MNSARLAAAGERLMKIGVGMDTLGAAATGLGMGPASLAAQGLANAAPQPPGHGGSLGNTAGAMLGKGLGGKAVKGLMKSAPGLTRPVTSEIPSPKRINPTAPPPAPPAGTGQTKPVGSLGDLSAGLDEPGQAGPGAQAFTPQQRARGESSGGDPWSSDATAARQEIVQQRPGAGGAGGLAAAGQSLFGGGQPGGMTGGVSGGMQGVQPPQVAPQRGGMAGMPPSAQQGMQQVNPNQQTLNSLTNPGGRFFGR